MVFRYIIIIYFPNLIKIAIANKINKIPITIKAIIKILVIVELFDTFEALLIVVDVVVTSSSIEEVVDWTSFWVNVLLSTVFSVIGDVWLATKILSSIAWHILNDKFSINMWISLDKDVLVNITPFNSDEIIRYLYERFPYWRIGDVS